MANEQRRAHTKCILCKLEEISSLFYDNNVKHQVYNKKLNINFYELLLVRNRYQSLY